MEVFHAAEEDENVIGGIVAGQRDVLEQEIAGFEKEARAREAEIEELVGTAPFQRKTGSETHPARPAARRRSHAARELAGEVPF